VAGSASAGCGDSNTAALAGLARPTITISPCCTPLTLWHPLSPLPACLQGVTQQQFHTGSSSTAQHTAQPQ
jgi:hypothetical protein